MLALIMGKRDRPHVGPSSGEQALKHNPFAALSGKRDALEPGHVRSESALPAQPPEPANAAAAAPAARAPKSATSRGRLVLRRETKHRGGKAVIIVYGFSALRAFPEAEIEALARELKNKLGCGGTVESERGETQIVLQGDRAAKVAELLRTKGFRVDGVTA